MKHWLVDVRTASGGTRLRYVTAPTEAAARQHVQASARRGETVQRVRRYTLREEQDET